MEYKLYKGFILGPGLQNPAYGIFEVEIFKSKEDVASNFVFHTAENEWEAQLWIDRQMESGERGGWARQDDVNSLNRVVEPKYPDEIMQRVRQRLGLQPGDASRDKEINNMPHEAVFYHCLEWEGIIGWGYKITGWIQEIYGVTLK